MFKIAHSGDLLTFICSFKPDIYNICSVVQTNVFKK